MKNFYISLMLIVISVSSLHAQLTWTQKANIPSGFTTKNTAFTIGLKGYVGGNLTALWEYDPQTNTWTQKANFIGGPRISPTGFSIGTKGYIGTGAGYKDFYEYDQPTNTWTQKTDFGGTVREGAISFATATKGYIGTGSGNYLSDLWEYDPTLDAWTQKAAMITGRWFAAAFCINDKGYVYGGYNGAFLNDLWEYDPATNLWTQKSNKPGTGRNRMVGFAIGTKGYIGFGLNMIALSDFYEWDQPTDTWTTTPFFPGNVRLNAVGITIGSNAYVGTGDYASTFDDWWEFGNSCSISTTQQNVVSCASLCNGTATVISPDPGAVVSYSWNTVPVQTTQTATGLCPASFIVTMTDSTGCTGNATVIITGPPAVAATATATEPLCFGASNGSLCGIGSGGSGIYSSWVWSNGQTSICATGIAAGTYTVTVTDDQACSGTSTIVLSEPTALQLSFSHTDATCPTCPNGNATANISGGINPYQFSWSNGVTNSAFVPNLLPGTYTCCITDANGCTVCDSVVVLSPSLVGSPNDIAGITVYPDPFTDFIHLSSQVNTKEMVTCEILDVSGRLIHYTTYSQPLNNRIDTHKLEAGIYFLRLSSEGKVFVKKMVKD